MDEELASEVLEVLRLLAKECQLLSQKAAAMDSLLHDKTAYGLAYDHALGRVPERKEIQAISESVARLQAKLDPPASEPRRGFQTKVK